MHHLAVLAPDEVEHHGKAQRWNKREWMRRIDGERREEREHLGHEAAFEVFPILGAEVDRLDDGEPLREQA